MGFFKKLLNRNSPREELKKIYAELRYNKIPALPRKDNEINRLLTSYQSMPILVPKKYMNYLEDTQLIFGHIVMLWWIDNHYKNQRPQYFIYQYGLNF